MSDDIERGLAPLFERAEREGLWFQSHYQGIWLSPAQLREAQAKGQFRWGAINWTLRDPRERLAEVDAELAGVQQRRNRIAREMAGLEPKA